MKEKWMAFLDFFGLGGKGQIHYVGGTDVLPPPLKGEQEHEALMQLEQGSESAKQLLIERNLRLVAHIMKKY